MNIKSRVSRVEKYINDLTKTDSTYSNSFDDYLEDDDLFIYNLYKSNRPDEIKEIFYTQFEIINYLSPNSNNKKVNQYFNKILRLKSSFGNPDFLDDELKSLVSDSFVLIENYKEALDFFPNIPIDGQSYSMTEQLMSLKYVTQIPISSPELLSLYGPQVTQFGKEFLSEIRENLDLILSENPSIKQNLLSDWVGICKSYKYSVFTGFMIDYEISLRVKLRNYSFGNNKEILDFIKNITRESENRVRAEKNIPFVGEGWVAETNLYYQIKNYFTKYEVQHHAKPNWLKNQHLDIFIPKLKLAIEYQGEQHSKPVEYFGGESAFVINKKRDIKKKMLCTQNGVKLIEVFPNYEFKDVVESIESIIGRV